MEGAGMTEDHLSGSEAADLGTRLDTLCREISPRQTEFLKSALRLAAAALWARTNQPVPERGIQDLIVDIQQAGAAGAISLNPLPIPLKPKGQSL
jgi:hypothetical protein